MPDELLKRPSREVRELVECPPEGACHRQRPSFVVSCGPLPAAASALSGQFLKCTKTIIKMLSFSNDLLYQYQVMVHVIFLKYTQILFTFSLSSFDVGV